MTADLRTRYLGLELRNPVVASASPLCGELDTLKRIEEAGAAAVVLPSLFEEQIEHEEIAVNWTLDAWTDSYAEAATYFPEMTTTRAPAHTSSTSPPRRRPCRFR